LVGVLFASAVEQQRPGILSGAVDQQNGRGSVVAIVANPWDDDIVPNVLVVRFIVDQHIDIIGHAIIIDVFG
jgi:hypothetical protein